MAPFLRGAGARALGAVMATLLGMPAAAAPSATSATSPTVAAAEPMLTLASPNGRNLVTMDTNKLTYAVHRNGKAVIAPSPLGLKLDIASIGAGARFTGQTRSSVDARYRIVLGKAASAPDRYQQAILAFTSLDKAVRFELIVRAYDNGVALRYAVPEQGGLAGFKVMNEATQFFFAADFHCWGANMGRFDSSFEAEYDAIQASQIRNFHNFMAPLVCKTGAGQTTFAIAESDVSAYPGFFLSGRGDGGPGVSVTLPPRFDNDRHYRFRKTVSAQVSLRGDGFKTPWRVIMLGDTPGELAASSLIATLAAPSRIDDTSWIKPAKTAWDWWSDWDIALPAASGPGIKAGINTATYKAYVDFARAMKLDAVLIDEGWSIGSDVEPNRLADVTRAKDVIDMPELLAYARAQGVGVWLWVQWQQLDQQMDAALAQYQAWGVKGIKVDFMNRNDQEMVEWYHTLLEKAAAHRLMVNLHGAYPPTGLQRTWPNFITQEGVLGAENNKWSARITARHNVTLPFTRMILGPMDYTPGGFRHATPATFTPRHHAPMVMTTRGHALAMYVVYDSPLQMVSDGPAAYRSRDGKRWAEGAEFLQQVPTTWDETRILAGDIGQFIVSARRRGDTWYIGAMSNEQGRSIQVPLDFLGQQGYRAHILQDGASPDRLLAKDTLVKAGQRLRLTLAPSGGAVVRLTPQAAQAGARTIALDLALANAPVDRFYDLSVGADFPGTLLRDDSMAHLKTTVDELGFRYLRFHAIFHDALGTVRIDKGKTVYDWNGIDRLYDAMLARGIKPFVELGFTPKAMATSSNKIFYWEGNTSHPQPGPWRDLVDAYIRHLLARYGQQEVRSWYFEVWNEPNLAGFWENADQKAYFALYDLTANTIKQIDPALRVGGPSTAGAAWVPEFLAHVARSGAAVDFVSTHTYGVDGGFLDEQGKEDTKLSASPDAIIGDVRSVRAHIAASGTPQLPLFFTEWSTSYTPRDLVHDTYISAPYILSKLKGAQGMVQAMSYWTYTDLFEESGPPPTPFHGGFGLLNREGIRKPAFFAYKYLNALRGEAIPTQDAQVLAATDGDTVNALVWDFAQPVQAVSNKPFYSRIVPAAPSAPVVLTLRHLAPGSYRLQVRRTGFRANDAYSDYIDMGAPASLTAAQRARLESLTRDLPEKSTTVRVGRDGVVTTTLAMRSNDIVLVSLRKLPAR